ncbi:MAG: filamentous hemagglutinin N-terminal domain-containing protein, partial [Phyllobacterium sp.]
MNKTTSCRLSAVNGNDNAKAMGFGRLARYARGALAALLSGLLVFQPALVQAQKIKADAGAPAANQPAIGSAPNGVPLIDIVAPDKQGLSHNIYDTFNVGTSGLILNNHNGEVGTSHLGGATPGNPDLRDSGSASIILNEVTKQNRSTLEGPIEVFGGRADVIIANPNGISCNGCGFINTPHATLTSGTPDIDAMGHFGGFTVDGGDVTFGKNGGNFAAGTGSVDLFEVVSRSIHIDGPVYGKDLRLTAGRNTFDYATGEAKALEAIAGVPDYAIDGSALGAMQANRITLVATEKGAGVRMRGDMAANAGELSLSSEGKISIGNVSGSQGIGLRSKAQLEAKRVTSRKRVTVQAGKGIVLRSVAGDGDILLESGLGLLSVAGDVTSLHAIRLSSAAGVSVGRADAGDSLAITAASGNVAIAGAAKSAGALTLSAGAGSIEAASLISFGNMALSAGRDIGVTGDVFSAGNLNASARSIKSGAMASGIDLAAKPDSTGKPVLKASGDLRLTATSGDIHAAALLSAGGMN